MYRKLCPRIVVNSLFAIEPAKLIRRDIRGMILDLDNTIIPWDSDRLKIKVTEWMNGMQQTDLKLCIVSNNRSRRVKRIAEQLNVPYVSNACKPLTGGLLKAVRILCMDTKEIAMIGDQVFTDILGGNRLGLFTILVPPLNTKAFFFTTNITRHLGKIIINKIKTRRLMQW